MPTDSKDIADVLVVDDHKIIRREVSARLRQRKLRVHTASSASAALRLVRRRRVRIAVIDLRMPQMDGIELAKGLLSIRRDTSVIFLTAYDSDKSRKRAEAEGIRAECWIDKHPTHGIANALSAVMLTLNRQLTAELHLEFDKAAKRAGLSKRQLNRFKMALNLSRIMANQGYLEIQRTLSEAPAPPTAHSPSLDQVIQELVVDLDELNTSYSDPADRELRWNRIRNLIAADLWRAADSANDPYVRQLCVQLEQAVRRVDAPLLNKQHIEAAYLSVERLRSGKVTRSDVGACKQKWRQIGVDTVPSFRKILKQWEDLYSVEGPEESEERDFRGNDNSTS
jgi:CheY-like chemotaxis protein